MGDEVKVEERLGADDADLAQQRLIFLAEASRVLASSLDYEMTLAAVARLAVPQLADWCAVDLLTEEGELERLAVAHVDPAKVAWAHALQQRYPTRMDAPTGVPQVIRSRQPTIYPLITDEMLAATISDPEQLALARALGFTSVITMPLVARDRAFGALTLVSAESGRQYSVNDVTLAEDLARRAAVAIDNARLLRDAQIAEDRAQQQARRAQALAAASQAFAEAYRDLPTLLETIAARVSAAVGDSCIIRLLSDDGQYLEPVSIYHSDPALQALLWRLHDAAVIRADQEPYRRLLATGQPVLLPTITPDALRAMTDPSYHAYLDPIALRSVLMVPLRVRGQVSGTLGVARHGRDQPYTLEDQTFLQDLADRAAQAVENVRLYQEVQRQGERFAVTLASIGDAVITTDAEGRVTFLNPVAEALTGWSQAEALGQDLPTIFQIVNEFTHAPGENPVSKVLRLGTVVGLANHTVLIAKDGTERPIDDSGAPIRDSDGAIVGVVLVFRDISERQHAEAIQAEMAAVVESSDDAIFTKTLEAIVRSWNPAAVRLYGYTPDEIIGRPISILAPPDRPDEIPGIMERIRRGQPVSHLETVRVRKDGTPLNVSVTVSPIRDAAGEVRGASTIARDITAQKQAEAALRESEARFHSMADHAPVMIWTADSDAHCDYVSRPWLEFTGRTIEQELDDGWTAGVHPDDLPGVRDTYRGAYAGREPFRLEFRLRRADGVYRWVLNSGVPRWTPGGAFAGYIGSCIDITERKEAEERQQFLAQASTLLGASLEYETTLANVARLAVPILADNCVVDLLEPDGAVRRVAVTSADPATEARLRELQARYATDPREVSTRHAVVTGQSLLVSELPDSFLQAAAYDADHLALLRAINARSLLVMPMRVGERVMGALTLGMGVSGRRFSGEDLPLVEELAHRAALAVENARLYQDAQQAIRTRDQFFSIAAHELRTPITALLGYTQLLQRRVARMGTLEARDLQSLQALADQSRRLDRLISALLDLSRIQTGQLSLDVGPVDLAALVRQVADDMRPTLDQHTLTLTTPATPLWVTGDEIRLEQVVQNLLQNAVKYSPEGGAITIEVERDGDLARLRVGDQGMGIPPAALPQLFQRFYRAPNVDPRQISGLGIGLYVIREIVALHSGQVEVDSTEGQGSTFTVTLPALPALPDEGTSDER